MTLAVPAARLGARVAGSRLVLGAMIVPLWLGLSLLPGTTSPTFRLLGSVALAALVGVGAELAARPEAPAGSRRTSATLWIVPAGLVLVALYWLSAAVPRPPAAPALGALAIVGAVLVQSLELAGESKARGAAHAASIGLALLVGTVTFHLAFSFPGPLALGTMALTSAALALVVLRTPGANLRSTLLSASATVLVVLEVGALILALSPPAGAGTAVLTLTLGAAALGCALLESRTVSGSGDDGDIPT